MALLVAALLCPGGLSAAEGPGRFTTPVTQATLDPQAFAEFSSGRESPVSTEMAKNGPRDVIWTQDQRIEWRGVEFGESREPGPRSLRIGFTQALPIGSVVVRGGGVLSVLKPDAPYPGRLDDETHWQPAERLGGPTEVDRETFAIWTLPPGATTRALRFTHHAEASDTNPAGWLGGAWVLTQRVANVAPQATAQTSAREEAAKLVNDQSNNRTWGAWDNGEKGAEFEVSPEHPAIVTLRWPSPVALSGVCLLWAGLGAADVEYQETPAEGAASGDWQTLATSDSILPLYPLQMAPNWLDFGRTVHTSAIRLKITKAAPAQGAHPHIADKLKDGKRVWLGELLAITPLADAPLASVEPQKINEETPPPIPVKFTLPEAGVVTLVIEDGQGRRVRNLVSETPFPAGENTAWWDGSDDLLRDPDAAAHGLYHIPTRFVAPGQYTVRGLWRQPIKLLYEQSVYTAGKPAWETADKTGCWMTNHTPPTSLVCVPGQRTADGQPLVFMGAFVAEGGHGLQWVREDGTKVGGQGWVGGTWTGAPTLACDRGPKAVAEHLCYASSVWEGEWRLTAKDKNFQDKPILKLTLGDDPPPDRLPKGVLPPKNLEGFDGGDRQYVLAGVAAHDGTLVGSFVRQNVLQVVDVRAGKVLRTLSVTDPRGVAFDGNGRLLVLSGTKLLRMPLDGSNPETIIATDLEDPRQVALDAEGRLYVSDRGASHQVKVFSPLGQLLHAIGKPGEPQAGPYDPLHMNNPNGLGVDSQGRVWVTEDDFHPKRVSVWSPAGQLVRAFYGPGEYGGGGVLDSADKTKFFYKGQEFKLDWQTGTDELVRVFYRPDPLFEAHYGPYSPDWPIYIDGRRYFTSCYTHNPTNGDSVAFIWIDDAPVVRLVAGFGSANEWRVLHGEAFKDNWPAGLDPRGDRGKNPAAFSWSDRNGDGKPQPDEVTIVKAACSGVTVQSGLRCVAARFNDAAALFRPTGFNEHGAPLYDVARPETLAAHAQSPKSSGGDQALTTDDGWTIHTVAPEPFSPYSLGGTHRGEAKWSYPNPWPGLHASHEAAIPDQPGQVIGVTRLLGDWIKPNDEAGPVFGVNANMGNMYLFTADGLFVSTLFHDIRLRPNWAMPTATRGMDVTNVSLHDENFWPSLTQTADGQVYVVDGGRVSLVRVDGLDSIKRIAPQPLEVTTADLANAHEWMAQEEAKRQAAQSTGPLRVVLTKSAPTVDGRLDDWPAETQWATIDRRGVKANFNSNSQPYDVSAAARVSGDRLYLAWRSNEKDLLKNSGEAPQAMFKTGGGLDLMLGASPDAPADRAAPAPGDVRLIVSQVKGRPRAVLYRAKVPGTAKPVAFSSPWRTLNIDVVEDVTDQIAFAAGGEGRFEVSVPLALLGWQPTVDSRWRADLGVLRGDGQQTTQRVYWSNKATGITADVPSEAELTPKLWGEWTIAGE